ncbi:unnamed protein product [Brassica oleracea var. botrytis]
MSLYTTPVSHDMVNSMDRGDCDKHSPRTFQNFVELSQRGYYDNVLCHRIIKVKLAEVIGSFTTPRRMALFWSDKKDLLIETTTQIRTLLCGDCNVIALNHVTRDHRDRPETETKDEGSYREVTRDHMILW